MSAYAEKGKQMNLRGDRSDVSGIDWPYNLLQQIGMDDDDPLDHMSDEAELLLVMSLRNMTEREKKVIILRYFEQKTLKEVGEIIGVQQERVRQIEAKAIRKMRWNDCHYILTHGIKAYIDKRVDEKVNEILKARKEELEEEYKEKLASAYIRDDDDRRTAKAKLLATTIEEMDMSVRAYNCLKRACINKLSDFSKMTYDDLLGIRNLGSKCVKEVLQRLMDFGVTLKEEGDDHE